MIVPLREARGRDEFVRDPIGACVLVETSFVWCASPTLAGSVCWGAPNAEQTRRMMSVLEAVLHPSLGPEVDVILDAHALERVDPGAALVMFSWTREHITALKQRIRMQIGVAPPGVGALILSGTLPLLGDGYPYRVVTDPGEAYRMLLGKDGQPLFEHISSCVSRAQNLAPVVASLRGLLRAHDGNLALVEAARLLHRSSRTLQRELGAAGTNFRVEQREARLSAAREMLSASDDKLLVIAERLGLSEDGLNLLVRERLGITPEVWRRQLRAG